MSRGRRNRKRATVAAPSSAGVMEDARALIIEVAGETDRVIAKSIARALEGKDPVDQAPALPEGGGVGGDLGRPARDLVEIALWASAVGEREQVEELLGRALAHQKAHAQLLADRRRDPASLDGEVLAGERQAAADWMIAYLTPLAASPERFGSLPGQRAEVRSGFGERRRLGRALEGPLAELARAGEQDAVRQLAGEAWEAMGDPARAQRARAASDESMARWLRVAAALEYSDPAESSMRFDHGFGISPLLELVGTVTEDQITIWGDGRDPLADEMARLPADPANAFPRELERVATDAAEALTLARARLRRGRLVRRRAGAPASEGTAVRVAVGLDALAQLAAEHGGRIELVEERDPRRPSTVLLRGSLRLAADTPDGPVEVRYLAAAGTSRSADPDKKRALALGELTGAGIEPERIDSSRLGEAPPSLGPAHLGEQDPRIPGWWALLGHERCAHPDHDWKTVGNVKRLSCRTCGRANVASVPLHRLSYETILNPDHYLVRERFQAALRGDTRPISSLKQLRERDGEAPRHARDYALGPPPATPPQSRASSLAGALGRTRR